MKENWKPVVGYEGHYEVSDLGNVRSLDREVRVEYQHGPVVKKLRGKVLKFSANMTGHLQVKLYRNDGPGNIRFVHRLVLEAFEGTCPPGHQACHWDDDPTNNRLENLRWDTPSANTLDSVRNGNHNQARKTQCPQGHEFDDENTYVRSNGKRECLECKRAGNRASYARKKKREAHRQLTGRSA